MTTNNASPDENDNAQTARPGGKLSEGLTDFALKGGNLH